MQTALYDTLEAAGFSPTVAEPAIFKKTLKVSDVSPNVYKRLRGKDPPENRSTVLRIPRTNQKGETTMEEEKLKKNINPMNRSKNKKEKNTLYRK